MSRKRPVRASSEWGFPEHLVGTENESELRREHSQLRQAIDRITDLSPRLDLQPIDDSPDCLGLEVLLGQDKLAEVFCGECQEGLIQAKYAAHVRGQWDLASIVDLQALVSLLKDVAAQRP